VRHLPGRLCSGPGPPPPRPSTRTAGRSVVSRAHAGPAWAVRAPRSASRRSPTGRPADSDRPRPPVPGLGGRARRSGRAPFGAYATRSSALGSPSGGPSAVAVRFRPAVTRRSAAARVAGPPGTLGGAPPASASSAFQGGSHAGANTDRARLPGVIRLRASRPSHSGAALSGRATPPHTASGSARRARPRPLDARRLPPFRALAPARRGPLARRLRPRVFWHRLPLPAAGDAAGAHDATRAVAGQALGPPRRRAARFGRLVHARNRRRPTLPGPCGPSTIGAVGLNCSVRNGKRCFPHAKATGNMSRPAARVPRTARRSHAFGGPSKLHSLPTQRAPLKISVKPSTH
jgi:hypothetical protein